MAVWKDSAGRWHVEVRDNGRRIHRRCPEGATAQEARALEATFRRDQWLGKLGKRPEPLLSECLQLHLDDLKAKRSYARSSSHAFRLVDHVAGKRLPDAPEVAAAFARESLADGYAPATINRSLAALRRACSLALKRGLTDISMARRIELLTERNAREVYLSAEEIAAICAHDPEIAPAVRIAAYTGIRLGELLALKPADVTRKTIRIRGVATDAGKAGGRTIPAVEALRADLATLPLTRSRRSLQGRFTAACKAIGRPGVHWHDLRHSCASLLVNAGVDLYVVGQILGHRAVQTTKRYSHVLDETRRAALEKIATRITPAEVSAKARKQAA